MALDSRISGDEALETWRTSALIPEDAFWDLWLELRQSPRAPMESVGQRDARFERARTRDKHSYSRLVNELLTSQGRESISLAQAERDLQRGVDVALAQRLEGPARAAELRRALAKTEGVPLRPDDVKRLSDAEVYAAYLRVDSRWRRQSGVGAPELSYADELQKMLRGQPHNARGVRQALQEARELLFEESSLRYDDFRRREGEIQRARVGGAILSGLTFGFFDLESLGIYDPAVLQLAREESSAALDALITGIEWAPVAGSLGVGAARTLAPRVFGRPGARATSVVTARRATGVMRRTTSARRRMSRGVVLSGPEVAARGGATLGNEIDEALAAVRGLAEEALAGHRRLSVRAPGTRVVSRLQAALGPAPLSSQRGFVRLGLGAGRSRLPRGYPKPPAGGWPTRQGAGGRALELRPSEQAFRRGKIVNRWQLLSRSHSSRVSGSTGRERRGARRAWRFIYDNRDFKNAVSPGYWRPRGGAGNLALHHWLFPQKATWVPRGFRNAGFNLVVINARRNSWMGGALSSPLTRTSTRLRAHAVQNLYRVVIPGGLLAGVYIGWKIGWDD